VAHVSLSLLPVLAPVLARLRRLLDLDAAPQVISAHLAQCSLLAPRVAANPGQRVPGTMQVFELAVRTVLGQQVSVRGATTLAGRLVQAVAEPLPPGSALPLTHAPLTAARLADATLSRIIDIGLPRARAECLRHMARAVCDGTLPWLDDHSTGAPASRQFAAAFTAVPGIGPWTAEYVGMRALRLPDAFPDSDLALRKAAGNVTAARLRALSEEWRPWRAYAAMHLWSQ
jgi:AraC family transcriptional regulator of adaptative response / DNA-3-methyladenine glycosylase II